MKKYGPNERIEQNPRKKPKQNRDNQPIRCRVQNTGDQDAQGTHWVFQQHKKTVAEENQDGGVGRHTVPPRTIRTDRKSNSKEVHTKEIKNKHSSRPVGGSERGTRVERTPVAVAGPRLLECGTNWAGSPTTSRPCGPTFMHR